MDTSDALSAVGLGPRPLGYEDLVVYESAVLIGKQQASIKAILRKRTSSYVNRWISSGSIKA
jgi:hypothetical protein